MRNTLETHLNAVLVDANLNGENLDRVWFMHSDLIIGGKLLLEMGSKPNKQLGTISESFPGSVSKRYFISSK